jgi:hypothetical protein
MATTIQDDQADRLLMQGEDQHGPVLGPQEARQGFMTGHMRWVLAISMVAAVLVIFGCWAFLANKVVVDQRAGANPPSAASRSSATP